jgi:hypothetical protein
MAAATGKSLTATVTALESTPIDAARPSEMDDAVLLSMDVRPPS